MRSPRLLCCNPISDQKKLILENSTGGRVQVTPFIEFQYTDAEEWLDLIPKDSCTWIFTSKRAVKAVRKIADSLQKPEAVYAVGPNTAEYIDFTEQDIHLPEEFNSASLTRLLKKYKPYNAVHFKGNLSGTALVDELTEYGIKAKGIEVYKTIMTSSRIDIKEFDAFLYLSPSAATSFAEKNEIPAEKPVFCIGSTTASAIAQLGGNKIFTPQDSSFESLTETIKTYFN